MHYWYEMNNIIKKDIKHIIFKWDSGKTKVNMEFRKMKTFQQQQTADDEK